MPACGLPPVWKSIDNLKESVPSFYHMGLGDWTQTTGPGSRCLYPMGHPSFLEVYSTWITSLPYTSAYISNKHSVSCSRLKCLAWFPCPACTVIAEMIVDIFCGSAGMSLNGRTSPTTCKSSGLIPAPKMKTRNLLFNVIFAQEWYQTILIQVNLFIQVCKFSTIMFWFGKL